MGSLNGSGNLFKYLDRRLSCLLAKTMKRYTIILIGISPKNIISVLIFVINGPVPGEIHGVRDICYRGIQSKIKIIKR
jgi:hypothetical protein